MSESRVGLGYDVHRLVEGRPLILGGVTIDHEKGLLGHSDADVVCHALIDALLGAMRTGDIGEHFPDDDPVYEGASSLELLRTVGGWMSDGGYRLVDADMVIVAEEPKIAPHRPEMRRCLAAALGVEQSRIGLKATTTEGLGAMGRGEGIAVHAVALLERIKA